MVLEHYRYPEIFLRRTKKAFISIIDEPTLEIAKSSGVHSYQALPAMARKRGMSSFRMLFCRKIFATYLRQHGIESEMIDLFQGRVPKTVFARQYYRPNFQEECDKVRERLRALHNVIQ